MSILVSGILKSPAGAVIAGAQITVTALTTSPDLLAGVSASAVTSDTGYYGLNVLPGAYSLTVAVNGKSQVYGSFRLDGTETTLTLNMVLRRNLVEVSIPDALLVDFRQIQNNVADDLEAMRQLEFRASGSADNAARSAADAKVIAEAAARSEANAADSEKSAEQFAQNLQDAVKAADQSSASAALSATEAGKEAAAAKNSALEAAKDAALLTAEMIRAEIAEHADSASKSALNASDAKAASEKAASNAALSENNAAVSARAARTSEINAAGSVTKAVASAAAALVSQNSAKTSEDAASASAVKASVSEVNAYYSAAAALASQKAAKMSEDAAKASQVASATSADSASASAMSAQGSAINSTQAATDAIAAKNDAVRHVTGFDEHVSRQVVVITQSAESATTKVNADIAAATDINRNNAILAINQKQAEATGAIQATVGVAVSSADNAKKSETAARTSEGNADSSALRAETAQAAALYHAEAIQTQSGNIALSAADSEKSRQAADLSARMAAVSAQNAANSERNARNSEVAAAQSATTATAAAKDAVASAVPAAVEQVKTEIAGNVTRAETAATNAEASNAGAQQALEQARQIAKTPGAPGLPGLPGAPGKDGKSAWEIWKDNQPVTADTSMAAYLKFQEGKSVKDGVPVDLKGISSTTPIPASGLDFAGQYLLYGHEESNALPGHPIPGAIGNESWGVMWVNPRRGYPAQLFMNYNGKIFSRIKANYGWSPWWQIAGEPVIRGMGTQVFCSCKTAVSYGSKVAGETLIPVQAGTWFAQGSAEAGEKAMFMKIR
ncbi:carboxypeptidase regulatory-like domain-containing protein [Salmonella enterica subsp. enterica serovar Newport]|nr:carboxypeptidase regulatory-like domain-containing protein [Salmonella enterica subsp. enterica serovar Newport]